METEQAPLTLAQLGNVLGDIRQAYSMAVHDGYPVRPFSLGHTGRTLAALDVLRERLAALEDIARAVASYGYDTGGMCAFCGRGILHAPGCPVARARRLYPIPQS